MSPISDMIVPVPVISPINSQPMISPLSMGQLYSQNTPTNYTSPFEPLPADIMEPLAQPPPQAPQQSQQMSMLNRDNQLAMQLINNSKRM